MTVRILHASDSLVAAGTASVAGLGRAADAARERTVDASFAEADETVFRALDEAGVDRETVLGIDSSKLRDLADAGDVPEDAMFDTEERPYIRRQDLSVEE